MPQDAVTGACANEYGHVTARQIAEKLGATPVKENSNEFAYNGRLITIRCARERTTQVGTTYKMLDRVDAIVAALESIPDHYELYELSPALYKLHMRDSKDEGKVGLVTRDVFYQQGRRIRTVDL